MLYKDAGVDIDSLNQLKGAIGKEVARTFRKGIKPRFGLFGGTYPMGNDYLVASVDGVGTKLLIARQLGMHHTVGMDLVYHCVNDILTTGALPLFFQDYIGFSRLKKNTLLEIIKGIVCACRSEKIVLLGGETAQLKECYPEGLYDLVGFILGKVKKKNYINTKKIRPGNIILGLKSSGLHTNGYTLARRVLLKKYKVSDYIPDLGCTIGKELLKVHRSYRADLEPRLKYCKGLAHITGGGFYDNITRILPQGLAAIIKKSAWRPRPIFKLIQVLGKVPEKEMYRVFNMGIGMVVIIDKDDLKNFEPLRPKLIGEVIRGDFGVQIE